MKTVKDISAVFVNALRKKNIDLASAVMADGCEWFTGNHFGLFVGKNVCLTHLNKIFTSFPSLRFHSKWVACGAESCVFEYMFAEEHKIKAEPSPKDFNGVFILDVIDEKILRIRNYYEDRTISPRNTPKEHERRAVSAAKGTEALRHKEYPGYNPSTSGSYDPVTGLPLK